jgi:ent-kaurene oxidase
MRLFPTWTHGILKYFLPSIWKGSSYIAASKKLLVPEIKRREALWKEKPEHVGDESEDLAKGNLLSWMMECAEGFERDPDHLAHLEIVISLASIHTSQMNAVHVLYDLAAHPEFVEPLRDEIRTVAKEGWDKSAYTKLRKLDSFMKESQRFNPPSLLSYHRIMTQSHTLSDGTKLPKGAHIAMAVNAIQNDPEIIENPDVFDGLRYYNLRQRPGEGHLHQFVTTEPTMLNFGHGKNACPGRFFAALEIKSILVKLIMDYDFKLLPGQGRPQNLTAHEFIFPNPKGQLLMKQRAHEEFVY